VVDHHFGRLEKLPVGAAGKIAMDGTDLLSVIDHADHSADWIIPAIPHHVAFEWIRRKLEENRAIIDPIKPPAALLGRIPNPMQAATGTVYASHADFICPENCPEPANNCFHTGKPRPDDLWRIIAGASVSGFKSIVIQSHQLLAGVGGYPFGALQKAYRSIHGYQGKVILATACRCHGVIHIFEVN
jgi:hypothetical protein